MSRTSRRRRAARRSSCPKDSPIKTVADLKGKKVALNKGSNVHYLLVKALEKAGLNYSDIKTAFLPPADARAAFEKGAVDAWVIWDPFQAAAEAATGARTLADGDGIVANHQFYLATRDFAERQSEVVDAVCRRRSARSTPGSKANSGDVAAQFSPALGIPGADARSRAGAAVLRHQADRRGRRRRAAEDRRHVLRARPDPEGDHDRRRRAEGRSREHAGRRPRTSSGFCRRMATAGISARRIGGRAVDLDYLRQIAQAADELGYFGVLLPTGKSCEDSWVVASALAPLTERLRFLVAVRPGLQSPASRRA